MKVVQTTGRSLNFIFALISPDILFGGSQFEITVSPPAFHLFEGETGDATRGGDNTYIRKARFQTTIHGGAKLCHSNPLQSTGDL